MIAHLPSVSKRTRIPVLEIGIDASRANHIPRLRWLETCIGDSALIQNGPVAPVFPESLSPEHPPHHQRELFSPECTTVRPSALMDDDIGPCIAQRVCPPFCVLEKERLLSAGDKICARKRVRHNARWLVAAARRSAEDRTVDVWMTKPQRKG